uniref:Uncharacterized protein n=1 Tax=Anguilla anguilla TaxID=7936 RepID=A0A0E9PES2_ANGAN
MHTCILVRKHSKYSCHTVSPSMQSAGIL